MMIELRMGRRALLGGGLAALAAGAAGAAAPRRFFARHGLPLGLQLYTVAAEAKADLDGTLGAVARIGYRTVELAGYAGRTPAELRRALDRAGLRCTSSHVAGRALRPGPGPSLDGDLGKLAEDCHMLGCDTIVMPIFYIPQRIAIAPQAGEDMAAAVGRICREMTVADWQWNADYLNAKARLLRAHGIKLGYHNHNCEFQPLAGTTPFEILVRGTAADLVGFEVDVGWVAAAGLDPVALVDRHAGRVSALHVKDVAATTRPNFVARQDPAVAGQGIIDWKRLLPAAYRAGARRFFIEQEAPFMRPPLEIVARNFAYLDTLVTR